MLLLTLTVGMNQYAVDVARIVEVVPRVELRMVAHVPECLAGFLDYRGKVVPVIDLGLLLGIAPCRPRLSTRIILVDDGPDGRHRQQVYSEAGTGRASANRDRSLLGLIAERVSELCNSRPEQMTPPPICLPQTPYLDAIIQTDHGLVQLITVEKVRGASLSTSQSSEREDPNSLRPT